MMSKAHTKQKPIPWRVIYAAIFLWLCLMIVLMRLFSETYS